MIKRHSCALAALLGLMAAGCMDLEVINPNAADTERALRTPSDVEALVAGGWSTWWSSASSSASAGPILATVAYQHSATAANFGMVEFSYWPKTPVHARSNEVYYNEFANGWTWHYRAISGVVEGLKAVERGGIDLPAAQLARLRAYGYYVLGLAHGSTALMYDQGLIYDPSIDIETVTLKPYGEVMTAALSYFDKSIQEAAAANFTIPSTWMSREVSRDELVRMAYSMKARYRANVARNEQERAAVDWNAVKADAEKGITADWSVNVVSGSGFTSSALSNMTRYGPWGQLSYQYLGMADQSGQYQKWIARPPDTRHPNLSDDQLSDPFLIMTPDKRFPQGATVAAQQASDGTLFEIPTASGGFGAQWARPDRGTFRWSYYRYVANNMWLLTAANRTAGMPEITVAEMRMLRAEALFRTGDRAGAAQLINVSRTAAGLNPTDAAGTNTSCVPKLPTGQCGDLWEMLKWEFRLETMYKGLHIAPWYFLGRGWGDLAEGVFLHMPVPGNEAELMKIDTYTFGGPGGQGSAPKGNYGW